MTSGGNLNPANAELGGWMGRMRRRCLTRTASSINDLGSSPNGSRRDRAQCNSALPDAHRSWTTRQPHGPTHPPSTRTLAMGAVVHHRAVAPARLAARHLNHVPAAGAAADAFISALTTDDRWSPWSN